MALKPFKTANLLVFPSVLWKLCCQYRILLPGVNSLNSASLFRLVSGHCSMNLGNQALGCLSVVFWASLRKPVYWNGRNHWFICEHPVVSVSLNIHFRWGNSSVWYALLYHCLLPWVEIILEGKKHEPFKAVRVHILWFTKEWPNLCRILSLFTHTHTHTHTHTNTQTPYAENDKHTSFDFFHFSLFNLVI